MSKADLAPKSIRSYTRYIYCRRCLHVRLQRAPSRSIPLRQALSSLDKTIMSTALAKQVPLRGQVPQSGGLVDQSPVSSDSSQNEKSDSPIDAKTIIHTHRLTELSGELGAPADEKRFWWQRGKNFGTCTGFIAKNFLRRRNSVSQNHGDFTAC